MAGPALIAALAAELDLDAAQRSHLAELLAWLQARGLGLRALLRGQGSAALLAGDTFDRAAALRLWEAQLDALKAAGPELVRLLGEGFDALDFEQQQALRFRLRRLRSGRGA